MTSSLNILHTAYGDIEYTLSFKKIKNINLRIKPDGKVMVSAPLAMPPARAEAFIAEKAVWIIKTQKKISAYPKQEAAPPPPKEECLRIFTEIDGYIFPVFAKILGGQKPEIIVKTLKSRWGVCYVQKKRIVLNSFLATKPKAAIEYVILHEYVHFLHPNHGAGFHAEMQRLMPDYKKRRALLKQ